MHNGPSLRNTLADGQSLRPGASRIQVLGQEGIAGPCRCGLGASTGFRGLVAHGFRVWGGCRLAAIKPPSSLPPQTAGRIQKTDPLKCSEA